MTKIKGQNLRLAVGSIAEEKCIAAATACTVHLSAQIEDTTTKDSDSDWAENEVTGLNWDCSADAMVSDSYVLEKSYPADTGDTTEISSTVVSEATANSYYIQNSMASFKLRPGETINTTQIFQTPIALLKVLPYEEYEELAFSDGLSPYLTYTNNGNSDIEIAFAYAGDTGGVEDGEPVHVAITDSGAVTLETLQGYMENKTSVSVRFSVTNGVKNRHLNVLLAQGTAIITDISITAQNRQTSTFSCQLTGIGELTFSD